jgi:hypothetical protein
VKTIQLGKQEESRFYELYVENGSVFYRYNDPRLQQGKFEQFEIDLPQKERTWLTNPKAVADNKLLSGLLVKLQQDENEKFKILQRKVKTTHDEIMNIRTAATVARAAGRFVRPVKTGRDDDTISTLSSDSSRTNTTTGSFVEEAGRSRSNSSLLPPFSPTPSHDGDMDDELTKEGVLELSLDDGIVSEADHDPAPSSEETEAQKQAIYAELQAIVTLLAGLKGNKPQIERVREALERAIEKTGRRADVPEPTVEAPAAGAGTGTGAASIPEDENLSPAEQIQKNIDVLEQVQVKLKNLLKNHADKMDNDLYLTLENLVSAVGDSIVEAKNTLKTQEYKKFGQGLATEQHSPNTPQGPNTASGGHGDDEKDQRFDVPR